MLDIVDSFFKETTAKKLFTTLGLLALLVYFVPSAYLFYLNQSEHRRIEENYSRTVLKAIEGGALNFARMHAVTIANEQLDDLRSSINGTGILLVSAEIISGPNMNETIARSGDSTGNSVPHSCLVRYQTERKFDDAVYPFLIQLSVNRCEFQGQTYTQLIRLLLSGILIVSGFILLLILAVRPVQKSLITLLSIAGDSQFQENISLTQIPFLPLRGIAKVFFETQSLRRYAAIARTTQMLAHDVRKPFNLFRMTMDRVKSADTPEQMKSILNEAVPEVDRSLASVNGLISDVLNVGAEGQLELKPIRLAPVIDDVVDEVRRLHPKSRLDIKLDVPSELWVQADYTRIPRVFLNILSNAVEAVGMGGQPDAKLWVSARELDGKFVEVRVGNAGSYIAPDHLDKLFDLFFTSGKTGGTGLGLAIVKKIVTQHGGTVHCTSERCADFPNGRVEFVFTLGSGVPVVEVPIKAVLNDASATDVSQQTFEIRSDAVPKEQPADVQKPQVVFLDDSPLARWAWENKLKSHVAIRCFDGPKAFFQKIDDDSSNRIDLCTLHTIITDHYFTPDERLTGLELARELRNRGFTGRILLASNGEFSSSELSGIVDKIVDKQPVGWETLGV
jgi:signal transduction histidine kinase